MLTKNSNLADKIRIAMYVNDDTNEATPIYITDERNMQNMIQVEII